jgi:uncharacterized membrane protein YoaK (UPF0700 family)
MSKHETGFAPSQDQLERRRRVGLVLLLSCIAASTDVIGFLGLGVFTAHITGNIVILVAHLVAHGRGGVAEMISVPVFMAALFLTRWLTIRLESQRPELSVRVLLILQFVFLLVFFLITWALSPIGNVDTFWPVIAGMCGVVALAVQDVLVQTALPRAPSTTVLTTNLTKFAIAGVETVAGRPAGRQAARETFNRIVPTIVGFTGGSAVGGFLVWQLGMTALLFPLLLSLAAILARDSRPAG